MNIVIGSGPSGIACAAALIEEGCEVTLLDGGYILETEHAKRKARMALHEPEQWLQSDLVAMRTKLDSTGNVASKLTFGSDFPYRSAPSAIEVHNHGVGAGRSYAQGGLSNVWGAALMPFRQHDMVGWPVSAQQLEQANSAILKLMPFAAKEDDLAKFFPLYTAPTDQPKPAQQIVNLMSAMQANRSRLIEAGLHFGTSRVAAHIDKRSGEHGCNQCGLCLHGCPRDLIYSSVHTLKDLLQSGKLTYVSGITVKKIIEEENVSKVDGTDWSGSNRQFVAERVFLGAGVLNSTEILLRSFDRYDDAVKILDAQHYVFPLLQLKAAADVVNEKMNTLVQAYLEIMDAKISPYTVQIQLYAYNDLLLEVLKHKLGAFFPLCPKNVLLGRVLLAQGYLHSEHSGHIALTLKKGDGAEYVHHEGVERETTKVYIHKVLRKLTQSAHHLQAVPLKPLLQINAAGRGFHIGGSFPMNATPRSGHTDIVGRPFGWRRTHVIDASVFPSIPATTITQTVMANAYRIGKHGAHLNTGAI